MRRPERQSGGSVAGDGPGIAERRHGVAGCTWDRAVTRASIRSCHARPVSFIRSGSCLGCGSRRFAELEDGDLPIEREVFEGKITFVDSEIDPKTRTCRVFAEVENRGGLLRSGLECQMEIDLRNPSGTIDH